MRFKDEQGDIEITGPIFIELLKDTFSLGVSNTVMYFGDGNKKKHVLLQVNTVIGMTWGDDEWLKKFIGYLYKRARELETMNDVSE